MRPQLTIIIVAMYCWTATASGQTLYGEPVGLKGHHIYFTNWKYVRQGLYPGLSGVEGLATWPTGRLVALKCDNEGEFATVAIVPPGDRIRLNAMIPPTGYIKVAVRRLGQKDDLPGRTFDDADRLIGDSLAMNVTWKNDSLLRHDGMPIVLRFLMRQADLFGVEFY